MKKKNVINLIRYYTEKDDASFRNEAYEIAKDFEKNGDEELAEYIMAMLSDANTFVPQSYDYENSFLTRVNVDVNPLPLPLEIKNDVEGVINAINKNIGVNKFLFEGAPGTGKTETVKNVAKLLNRELYEAEFDNIIDSKLGQTSKNISSVFYDINHFPNPNKIIILFDEIDAIALDRVNSNDIREMGRAVSTLLKELDNMNEDIVIIATTNLFSSFDKAIIRRFNKVINFNKYSQSDLKEIADIILANNINKFSNAAKDMKLFNKVIETMNPIPYPGELKNIIISSLAFSNPKDPYDYMKRIYETANNCEAKNNIKEMEKQGFSVREIEKITGISKSTVAREVNGE